MSEHQRVSALGRRDDQILKFVVSRVNSVGEMESFLHLATSFLNSCSMPASPSSSSSSPGSPPAAPATTAQEETTPISSALVEGVASLDQNADNGLETAVTFTAPSTGDGDSEASFWDIIADSHPNLESYGDTHYDHEMSGFPTSITTSTTSTATSASHLHTPSTNLPEVFDDYQPGIDTSLINAGILPALMSSNQPAYASYATPSHYVTFEMRQDGTPFRRKFCSIIRFVNLTILTFRLLCTALSKPIVREDGLLLVGTEIVADSASQSREKNRIFVTNFLNSSFDETVVVTDLRDTGDPNAAAIIGKYDAHDVVSSVRWSPTDSHLSWTTDGGDFQVVDSRIPTPQLQVPLYTHLVNGCPVLHC
ncbi:unnamed protein product [Phytophthora fragariaefolia]|uniref:Unnamed protein product n=1 Tax=Phytophthora fragariaefolia TaxID=1490495 RepID=A0A9W7D346_9STRA|nr:unnamed protein product [Phytophthora fragariaefolia]